MEELTEESVEFFARGLTVEPALAPILLATTLPVPFPEEQVERVIVAGEEKVLFAFVVFHENTLGPGAHHLPILVIQREVHRDVIRDQVVAPFPGDLLREVTCFRFFGHLASFQKEISGFCLRWQVLFILLFCYN